MKPADSKKLDQIIAMLGDMVDVFGKRFDTIERAMATKEQIIALHGHVNAIEADIRTMKQAKLEARVADLEDEAFGTSKARIAR